LTQTQPKCTGKQGLYQFKGKAEFQELSMEAGDDLEVVKEDLVDGWSLVRNNMGEVGLLPNSLLHLHLTHQCPTSLGTTSSHHSPLSKQSGDYNSLQAIDR